MTGSDLDRVRRAELGRVPPEDTRHAAEPQCRDILAQDGARLRTFVDSTGLTVRQL